MNTLIGLRGIQGNKKNKGHFNGACNRTACQDEHLVTWYNDSTEKYYCKKCALMINEYNEGLCVNKKK